MPHSQQTYEPDVRSVSEHYDNTSMTNTTVVNVWVLRANSDSILDSSSVQHPPIHMVAVDRVLSSDGIAGDSLVPYRNHSNFVNNTHILLGECSDTSSNFEFRSEQTQTMYSVDSNLCLLRWSVKTVRDLSVQNVSRVLFLPRARVGPDWIAVDETAPECECSVRCLCLTRVCLNPEVCRPCWIRVCAGPGGGNRLRGGPGS